MPMTNDVQNIDKRRSNKPLQTAEIARHVNMCLAYQIDNSTNFRKKEIQKELNPLKQL